MEFKRDPYTLSTDKTRLDVGLIHDFLSRAYWAEGRPLAVVRKSIEHSLCFGVYEGERQIGFARVISDHATFAYLDDVFILEPHRGRGLAKWMLECILSHPDLQGLWRFALTTRDAHGLYAKVGFKPLLRPERFMEILNPDVYKR